MGIDLPTSKKKNEDAETQKEMRDCPKVLDNDGKKFIAILEEDSDYNSELWSALFGHLSSLPKKGDLVVYFPQGHLEYAKPYLLLTGPTPKEEVRTYDLQPQIICRVEHVQLFIKQKYSDICAHITLHPEPEANSEEKELEDCIWDEDRRPATISTSYLFSKTLEFSDMIYLLIPPKAAIEIFSLSQDKVLMYLQNEVHAKDFHGNEWKFRLSRDETGNWLLGWIKFADAENLDVGDTVVFLREKDTKLRFGIRRRVPFSFPCVTVKDNMLSPVAGAILKKSIFSVIYGPRYHPCPSLLDFKDFFTGNDYYYLSVHGCLWHSDQDFVIPYQKYMRSIKRPGLIGAKFHKQCRRLNSLESFTGVVTGMADLDPNNWPNSKWKCFTVTWEQIFGPYGSSREGRVSPWEIVCADSHSSSTFDSLLKLKRLQPAMPYLDIHNCLLSDESVKLEKQKHVQESGSIHLQGDTTNHPIDIEKQTPAPQTSSQFIPLPDSSSLTSSPIIKSTTSHKELISNCAVDDLWLHLKGNYSFENLEFNSCSFPSSRHLPIPITVKKLKITNCVDTEQVFTVLMDPKLSVESLEIDSCSSFSSMSTCGIPVTLRQLKIVNCMNLKSLSKSFETKKSSSVGECVHYSTAGTLELRKLEIQNCLKLESLPTGLHKLRNLDLLSINDCCSLEYFPEGGLPITCLTSLSISGCENLKCLPNKLHKVTSLQNLSICGCPSLMFFPEGGLPPNLVSLRIINCENLISISEWELHKLKHLINYSFCCGCSDSGE